jgi:glutaredoxin 3
LLSTYNLQPPAKIVEVDTREDGMIIKSLLKRFTERATFPNIIIRGDSLGGSDELHKLHESDYLVKILEKGGLITTHRTHHHEQ